MDSREKLKLLESLRLFDSIPKDSLRALADFLEPESRKDEDVVFEEGSRGGSLYFISSGRIRIMKKVVQADGSPAFKDLAILHEGDCFGEMALFEEDAPRSARAMAQGDGVLFKLERDNLRRWLESNPALAIGFFTELVQVFSKRLRRSSNELTLLFDLSQWLLEPVETSRELLKRVLSHLVPHLEGSWTAGAYLYNAFNDEMDLVAMEGDFAAAAGKSEPSCPDTGDAWKDDRTYRVSLPGKDRLRGYLIFKTGQPLSPEEKTEFSRTITTTARLISSALENIDFRTEDALRERLAAHRIHA